MCVVKDGIVVLVKILSGSNVVVRVKNKCMNLMLIIYCYFWGYLWLF